MRHLDALWMPVLAFALLGEIFHMLGEDRSLAMKIVVAAAYLLTTILIIVSNTLSNDKMLGWRFVPLWFSSVLSFLWGTDVLLVLAH